MMGENIGISTLVIMQMLQKPANQVDMGSLRMILHHKVLAMLPRCYKEEEVLYGASGYLYALLMIEKSLS
jgi:hypothetical protein